MSVKMSGKSPAKWVKLWCEEKGDFSRLPVLYRGFAGQILKFVDQNGELDIGTESTPAQELGRIMGAGTKERRALVPIINALVKVGCITINNGVLRVAGWSETQSIGDKVSVDVSMGEQKSVDGEPTVVQRCVDGSSMVVQRSLNGSRKSLKSLSSPPPDIDIELEIDRYTESNKTTHVELQSEVKTSAPSLPKNIPGGETESGSELAAGREGVSPTPHSAAPPSPSVSPSAIAGSPASLESISETETASGSGEKSKSILEPSRRLRAKKEKAPASAEVLEVWSHWKKITGSDKAQLNPARQARIEWALGLYGLEECRRCIDGYGSSDFHRGVNDRSTPYLDLTLWFRDEIKFEAGLALANTPAAQFARRQRVPQTPKEFASAAREAGKFFWANRIILGIDAEAHNNDWHEFVYMFCRRALEGPARRIAGMAQAEETLWATYNAQLDAWESDPNAPNIHPHTLCKPIAESVREWDYIAAIQDRMRQEQQQQELQRQQQFEQGHEVQA